MWADLEGERPATPGTTGALIERYVQEAVPRLAPRTQRDYAEHVKKLREVFGNMPPRSIRPVHIAEYLRLRGQDAPIQANREVAVLSVVFAFAMQWGYVDRNPCVGVKRHPEKGRDRYITDAEFAAVQATAGELLSTVMEFAYITAMRKGDILSLRLDQITTEGIIVKQGKTGKRQLFPWTPDLRRVVDRAKALPRPIRGLHLFCTRRGQPYTVTGFNAMWNRVQVKWAASGAQRFTFHDIRAKALTDAKRQGLDAQKLAGHASPAMTEHYIKAREIETVATLVWGGERIGTGHHRPPGTGKARNHAG